MAGWHSKTLSGFLKTSVMRLRPLQLSELRRGSSFLEIQVAMVLLAIGISGMYSLSVIQTRQTARLEQVLPADQIASINPVTAASPSEAAWAKKFGVYASIEHDAVAIPVPTYALNEGFQQIVDNEDDADFITHQALGGDDWEEYGAHSGDNELNVAEIQTAASYGSYALFIFRNVPPGDYDLFTYVPQKNSSYAGEFGSAVPHSIYDGGQLVATVNVDQRSIKQDFDHLGRWWERLGSFTFNDSIIYVLLRDTPKTGFRM